MPNFDLPPTYAPPVAPEIWNSHHGPLVRSRYVPGIHGDVDAPHPDLAAPLTAVLGGHIREPASTTWRAGCRIGHRAAGGHSGSPPAEHPPCSASATPCELTGFSWGSRAAPTGRSRASGGIRSAAASWMRPVPSHAGTTPGL